MGMSAVGGGLGDGSKNTSSNTSGLFQPFKCMFLCCCVFVGGAFGVPGATAGMTFNEVSSSPPEDMLLHSANSAWNVHPRTPWLSDLLRDLGQLALILFVSLEGTVLIYCITKPASGSPSSNKQFPYLRQPFQSPLDTLLLFVSASSSQATDAGHHGAAPV